MKAFGYTKGLPIENPEALQEKEIPVPALKPHDILVEVEAVSINPVDTKVRKSGMKLTGDFNIPGWDVVGKVVSRGPSAKAFEVGDEVYYAGSLHRGGAYSEQHAIDERIVARKPKSLSATQAAALPLTSLTAWEALFDRMKISPDSKATLLVIGGSGGVGSIAIQLAKSLTKLRVIATASRPESEKWCRELGADAVIDHSKGLANEFREKKLAAPDYILCAANTDDYFEQMTEIIKPQGSICSIVETHKEVPLVKLMQKSVSFCWEFMFTRSLFETEDMQAQSTILTRIAELVDAGKIKNTANNYLGEITLENLRRGHQLVESGRSIGKVVLGNAGPRGGQL